MERRRRDELRLAASMKLRSQPIDATTTPRQAPDQRRHHSFSSPALTPAASPAYSDHSNSRGFYSPRGRLDDDDDDEEIESDDDSELHEIEDLGGDFSRPTLVLEPAPIPPVTTTVSKSVRVEPRVVTRVDSGAKEKEVVETRVVEEDGVELGELRAASRRRSEEIRKKQPQPAALDSGPNERKEEVVEVRRGRRSEGRSVIVLDSAPQAELAAARKVELNSGLKREESAGARTVVLGPQPPVKEEFVVAEDGGESGRGVKKQSARRRQEGRKSEVVAMRKVALWLRVLGLAMCLISFSIMAADKNKGWALDSFDRYKEFRYCMAVSILGFVYSAAQACNVAYHLGTDKYSSGQSQFRNYLDFFMDQIISYLLISASSSAATRVEDWVSNWGRDRFPQMASASVIVSFLAFAVFAASSLVSGYTLCSLNFT